MTDVSLKEYFEKQIEWLDRHFAGQIRAINDATDKALAVNNLRLENMNQLREENRILAQSFDARIKSLEINRAWLFGAAAVVGMVAGGISSLLIVYATWVLGKA